MKWELDWCAVGVVGSSLLNKTLHSTPSRLTHTACTRQHVAPPTNAPTPTEPYSEQYLAPSYALQATTVLFSVTHYYWLLDLFKFFSSRIKSMF